MRSKKALAPAFLGAIIIAIVAGSIAIVVVDDISSESKDFGGDASYFPCLLNVYVDDKSGVAAGAVKNWFCKPITFDIDATEDCTCEVFQTIDSGDDDIPDPPSKTSLALSETECNLYESYGGYRNCAYKDYDDDGFSECKCDVYTIQRACYEENEDDLDCTGSAKWTHMYAASEIGRMASECWKRGGQNKYDGFDFGCFRGTVTWLGSDRITPKTIGKGMDLRDDISWDVYFGGNKYDAKVHTRGYMLDYDQSLTGAAIEMMESTLFGWSLYVYIPRVYDGTVNIKFEIPDLDIDFWNINDKYCDGKGIYDYKYFGNLNLELMGADNSRNLKSGDTYAVAYTTEDNRNLYSLEVDNLEDIVTGGITIPVISQVVDYILDNAMGPIKDAVISQVLTGSIGPAAAKYAIDNDVKDHDGVSLCVKV